MKQPSYDIIIAGGGLVGGSCIAALRHLKHLKIAVVEATPTSLRTHEDFDSRPIALSYTSYQMFKTLGLWDQLAPDAAAINTIHVSDKGHFGASVFTAEQANVAALGYVLSAEIIHQALSHVIEQSSVDWYCPAKVINMDSHDGYKQVHLDTENGKTILRAQLVIAADGADSIIRALQQITAKKVSYQQAAIVANIALSRSHQGVAYERFTAKGPLALLPLTRARSGLVWSMPPQEAKALCAFSEDAFLEKLQTTFGYRLGRFVKVGKRFHYPLSRVTANSLINPGIVLIGNAAQSLHPVAGQGFNLGLRDVATLAQQITQADRTQQPLGSVEMLQDYAIARQFDRQQTGIFCDFLPRVFTHDFFPLAWLRNMGLCTVDFVSPIKQQFLKTNMGIKNRLPDLMCGIPL